MILEVIYLITHGWTVREVDTRWIIFDHAGTQKFAIELAGREAQRIIRTEKATTVEVRIKTKWLKRIRDARTYGHDPRGRG
jgi:hypothetical protein